MAPRQEVPHALIDVTINRPIRQQPGSVTEVRRPPSQSLIEAIANLFPVPDVARPQEISHVLLNSQHALLRRTRTQIPVTIFAIAMRPERIPEKVKPLGAGFPELRLRFVQSQAKLFFPPVMRRFPFSSRSSIGAFSHIFIRRSTSRSTTLRATP